MKTQIEEKKVIEVGNFQLSEDAISRLEFIQNGLSDAPEKNGGLTEYQLRIKEIQDFVIHQHRYGEARDVEALDQLQNIHEISLLIDSLAKP